MPALADCMTKDSSGRLRNAALGADCDPPSGDSADAAEVSPIAAVASSAPQQRIAPNTKRKRPIGERLRRRSRTASEVELRGLEPLTSAMPWRRSPS